MKVVYSKEKPVNNGNNGDNLNCLNNGDSPVKPENLELKGNGIAPASCAFVPSVAGLIIASEVIKDLIR